MTVEHKHAKVWMGLCVPGIPSRLLRASVQILLVFLLSSVVLKAEVERVSIEIPTPKVWLGQRLTFFVEVRARGSFGGATTFSLPEIPRSLLLKIGSPIVSSEQVEGVAWFVQRHEFALFSQQSGRREIPAFTVRYGAREGFTGPITEVEAQVPAAVIEIQRPPGSDQIGFLITADSLKVTEAWEPQPGACEVGAVFKRTITQRADEMIGMALAPASTTVPEGIRVYPGEPEIQDNTERGDFQGVRRETLTYLMENPGVLTLPAVSYVWWNPNTEKLLTRSLPAVTFEITAPPARVTPVANHHRLWPWVLGSVLLGGGLAWRRRLRTWAARLWWFVNPPDQVAARRLLRACRNGDAHKANEAWVVWRHLVDYDPATFPEFQRALTDLQSHLFGMNPSALWSGRRFAVAFQKALRTSTARGAVGGVSALPPLNP